MPQFNTYHKNTAINIILSLILKKLDTFLFETYENEGQTMLVDFWEGDQAAIGLKHKNKVIYISNWEYKFYPPENTQYYLELEFINEETLETISIYKELDGIVGHELIDAIRDFLTLD